MEVVEMVVEKEKIFPKLILRLFTSYFSLFLLPFSFFFFQFFFFFKDTSKFQKNLHEIRIWRIVCFMKRV